VFRPCLLALAAAIVATQANPQDAASFERGKALYDLHCSACHGERLQNPGSSFDLRELHASERERFQNSMMNGKGSQMPSWRGTLGPIESSSSGPTSGRMHSIEDARRLGARSSIGIPAIRGPIWKL
jgi:mono/diheme cytochrome c family protein